jgi:predicted regulator of Ras-like GTPase activity (Roadblock/LC7/MglB family)
MATLPQLIEEDISAFHTALQDLNARSEAAAALLIDKGGFVIAQCVSGQELDSMTLAALSAASFAATETIASLVGEKNFTNVYQQGEQFSLILVNVDEYCIMAVIFKATLSAGAVKYYAVETIKTIADQMKKAHLRAPGEGLDLSMLNLADPTPVFKKKKKAA